MKAAYINEYGGAENIIIGKVKDPVAGKNDVLIRMRATSVNPVDWKVREGRLKLFSGKRFPLVLGTELSGEIIGKGENVNGFNIGDRVFAGLSHKGGACAEMVAVDQKQVKKIPELLSYEDAATMAVAGVTPLQAMTLHHKIGSGDEVLVNGASGGVGTFAVQIAKILGAKVTAVCSKKNFDLVKSLGADEVIDYNEEDFRLKKNAYDLVLDAAANAFFPEAKYCLKRGGKLIKLNLSIGTLFLGVWTKFFSSRKIKMILLKNRPGDIEWMIAQITSGRIKVIVDKFYTLDQVKEAHEYSQTGRVRGKLIIRMKEE